MINVCNMIIGQIDDTEDNANSKMMGNGRYICTFYPTFNSVEKG